MATLAGNTIASTYPLLLKIDSSGIDATLRVVEDGDATDSALLIATNKVEVKPGSNDANAFEVSQADGTAVFTVDTSNTIATINGNLSVTGSDATDQVVITNTDGGTGTAPDLVLYRNSASPADNDYIGQILMRGRNDNSQDVAYVEIDGIITDASDGTEDASLTIFTMAAGSQVNTMTLASGQVGIGETSPLGNLHVKSADSGASAHASADEIVAEGSANSGVSILSGTSGEGSIYFGDSGDNDIGRIRYNHSGNSMDFKTNTSVAMTIDSSGNVGINTSVPGNATPAGASQKYLSLDGGANGGVIEIMTSNNGNGEFIGGIDWCNNANADNTNVDADSKLLAFMRARTVTSDSNSGDDSGGYIEFATKPEAGTIAERMRIESNGFVGINRSSDIHERLTVSGMICSLASSATSSTAGNQRAIMDLTSNAARIGHFRGTNGAGSGSVQFFVDSVEKMRLLTGGGITFNGDTADANALDDYEEGTSQAAVTAGSGTIGLGTSDRQDVIQYTKIGDVVHFKARLDVTSNSSPSGELTITGLPFASNNPSGDAAQACTVYFENAKSSAIGTDIIGIIGDGSQSIAIRKSGETDSGAGLASFVDDDTNFIITGIYFT
jgi:hypothetical protein